MFLFSIVILLWASFIHTNASECGNDSLVKHGKNGIPKKVPWAVLVRIDEAIYCTGVIISPTQIATSICEVQNPQRIDLFFNRKLVIQEIKRKFLDFPSKTIKNPNWSKLGDYSILTLDKPLKISKTKAPICMSSTISEDNSVKKIYYRFESKYIYEHKIKYPFPILAIYSKFIISDEHKGKSAITYKKNGKWYFEGFFTFPEDREQTLQLAKIVKL